MKLWLTMVALSLSSVGCLSTTVAAAVVGNTTASAAAKPTIVLVHGAFAESASWDAVIGNLQNAGYPVIAVANPLRSVKSDAAYLGSIIASIPGNVVLVGHSYGGLVISASGAAAPNVTALVYVAGYAPDVGESAATIAARFPEGTLGQALAKPIPQTEGGRDLYIEPTKFRAQFAADVPAPVSARMAATQRPISEAALAESVAAAAWKTKPAWFIYGSLDKNIPRRAQAFMARRAKAKETVEVPGASHVVMISQPTKVAAVIKHAAAHK